MERKIALVGNPNSGKTTLFNALTGSKEYVGNRAGVTVDKTEARLKGSDLIIADLPGIYSLSVYSPEERAAVDCLLYDPPDIIVNVIDASNPSRGLYLTTQLLELGIPMIITFNMTDGAVIDGDSFLLPLISEKFNCIAAAVCAISGDGVKQLADTAQRLARYGGKAPKPLLFCRSVENALARIERLAADNFAILGKQNNRHNRRNLRAFAIRLFERDRDFSHRASRLELSAIERVIKDCESELNDSSDSIIAQERYRVIDKLMEGTERTQNHGISLTRRLDRIFANSPLSLLLFAAIITAVYFLSITLTGGLCKGFEGGCALLGEWLGSALASIGCAATLISLITDGIVAGVGAVLGFVPQLFVLFLLLAFLEECGYMARIAFILDRIFRRFGMSGKSIIPLIIGSGCGAVGISASRTIENESCRKISVITTTFIPCSAKLPLVSLIANNAPGGAWWTAPIAYLIGIASVFLSGIILQKGKIFKGEAAPFIMELPTYRLPEFERIAGVAWERVWGFIKKAGTVILLSSIAVRAGCMLGFTDGGVVWRASLPLSESILGKLGAVLSPIFTPLGFGEPSAAIAVIMGIIAKEEIVATLEITGFSGITPLGGFSFMVFNLLCAPCAAAIASMRRELGSWKQTLLAVSYQCLFAYTVGMVIFQIGRVLV